MFVYGLRKIKKKKTFQRSLIGILRLHLFNYNSRNSNIVKYYLVFSVTWSFRNYYRLTICWFAASETCYYVQYWNLLCCLIFLWKQIHFLQDSLKNRTFKRTSFIWKHSVLSLLSILINLKCPFFNIFVLLTTNLLTGSVFLYIINQFKYPERYSYSCGYFNLYI